MKKHMNNITDKLLRPTFCWNHFMLSSLVTRCWKPIELFFRRRWLMVNPDRKNKVTWICYWLVKSVLQKRNTRSICSKPLIKSINVTNSLEIDGEGRVGWGETRKRENYYFQSLEWKWKLFTWSAENNIEVHAINSNTRIVLYTQINVLLNTKAKVSSIWEVIFTQLVLSNL